MNNNKSKQKYPKQNTQHLIENSDIICPSQPYSRKKKVHIFGVLLFFPDETLHRRKTLVRNAVMSQYIYHYAPQMTF